MGIEGRLLSTRVRQGETLEPRARVCVPPRGRDWAPTRLLTWPCQSFNRPAPCCTSASHRALIRPSRLVDSAAAVALPAAHVTQAPDSHHIAGAPIEASKPHRCAGLLPQAATRRRRSAARIRSSARGSAGRAAWLATAPEAGTDCSGADATTQAAPQGIVLRAGQRARDAAGRPLFERAISRPHRRRCSAA